MNCIAATGPVDIKHDSTTLTCDLKCKYTYKYSSSGITVSNKQLYLSLKLTNKDSQTATYTSNKGIGECSQYSGGGSNYIVDEIRIYSPSLHTYNGNRADGELIIYHSNNIGGKNLVVCIPITTNLTSQNNASKQLTEIINSMSKIDNLVSESSDIQGSSFNLNNFIPNDYYYTYTASLPYYPCSKCTDYIVFDNNVHAINITSDTLKNLQNIIAKNEITIKDITRALEFTYSKRKPIYGSGSGSGSSSGSTSDSNNIYIECNPTGANGDILVEKQKDGYFDSLSLSLLSSVNIGRDLGSNILYNTLYIVILFIVIFGVIMLFKYLGTLMNCSIDTPIVLSTSKSKIVGGTSRLCKSCNKINKSKLKL